MDSMWWFPVFWAAFAVLNAAFCVAMARRASAQLDDGEGRYSAVLAGTIGVIFLWFAPFIVSMWITRYMPNGETKTAGYLARQAERIARRES